jgi:hypothetical protein
MVVVIDPYVRDTRGLAVLVIGDCDKVLVGLTDTNVVKDGGTLNVLKDDGELEGCTVLVIDTRDDEVDETRELEDCTGVRVLIAVID